MIHLSSVFFPLMLYSYDSVFILSFLFPISFIYILLDCLRLRNRKISKAYNYFFKHVIREEESMKLTGASYVFLSLTLIILFFKKEIAIPSLLIMSISDTLAALIGKRYGVIKFKNKTLEGSLAFLFSSIVIILMMDLYLSAAIISVMVATYIEHSSPMNVDDNLSVPFSFILSYLFFSNIFIEINMINTI